MARRHFLQPVISYRRRCPQRGFHITAFKQPALLRRMRPHTRQAIGLQFHAYGKGILLPRILFLHLADF